MADNAALTSELCVLQGHSNPQDFLEVRQDFSKHYSKSMRALHDYFHSNVGRSGLGTSVVWLCVSAFHVRVRFLAFCNI